MWQAERFFAFFQNCSLFPSDFFPFLCLKSKWPWELELLDFSLIGVVIVIHLHFIPWWKQTKECRNAGPNKRPTGALLAVPHKALLAAAAEAAPSIGAGGVAVADWWWPQALVFVAALLAVPQPALPAGAVVGAHCVDADSLCVAFVSIPAALVHICMDR